MKLNRTMTRNSDSKKTANPQLAETRAKIAWTKRKPYLLMALSKKETFEWARELVLKAYENMLRARLCDEKAVSLYKQNKCHFQIGGGGHEAVQAAAAACFNPETDAFFPYYRDFTFCASIGMSSRDFMLGCMNKADDPSSHGRQMPMHYGNKDLRIISQSSCTGTQFLQAVGYAHAFRIKDIPGVVYVSSGEGACYQGDFHEALNWASIEKLPVVFLVQNNSFANSVSMAEQHAAKTIYHLAEGYEHLKRLEADGLDLFDSYEAMQNAYEWAKNGKGPALVEAHVVRLEAHSISNNQGKYKSKELIAEEHKRCPIAKLRQFLIANKIATAQALDELEERLNNEIKEAAEWAEAQPDCSAEDATKYTFAIEDPDTNIPEITPSGHEILMLDAINKALKDEMRINPDIVVFGEDVKDAKGGVFGVTAGLNDEFGVRRVFSSPLAESSIVGVAIGMALQGLRPVPEIQFGDFSWAAMMQLRNELATMHYRSAGDFSCPAVIRIPVGGYIHGGPFHSQNIEGTFSHIPGLQILFPSNATDANGLLRSALRGKDPVLFLEHKGLYRQPFAKGSIGNENFVVPIGRARTLREGNDLTIISWGALAHRSLSIAKEFAKKGSSIEVLDLRSIVPFDSEAVFESVKRTNKVLIVHEDLCFMGFGAEIAAQIAENCFSYLDAPVKRVGMKYAAMVPHSAILEEAILPQERDIRKAVVELLSY